MTTVRFGMSWILGMFSLLLCLWTVQRLMAFLSFHDEKYEDIPCCGRYLKPLLWNMFLLMLFVLQHSGMRSSFWKRLMDMSGIDVVIDRMLYVIGSCVTLQLITRCFAALPGPSLWHFNTSEHHVMWLAIITLHFVMWVFIIIGALATDPLELVGLRQLFHRKSGMETSGDIPWYQEYVSHRHVGVVAMLLIIWIRMSMPVERFVFALVFTFYLLLGSRLKIFDYVAVRKRMDGQRLD